MTRRHKNRPRFWRKKWRSLYIWHRYLGLTAAALVVILSVSGMILNHSDKLELAQKHVTAPWLLSWYGIAAKTPMVSFELGNDRYLSALDGRLFLDGQPIGKIHNSIKGAIQIGEIIAVATPLSLALYTHAGELIENLDAATLPGKIEAIGTKKDPALILKTDRGVFASDTQITTWTPVISNVIWATRTNPPAPVTQQIMQAWRGAGLSWERVMLDLHSGRIFGNWGIYLMDGAALILLVLSATGIIIWAKSKRRRS